MTERQEGLQTWLFCFAGVLISKGQFCPISYLRELGSIGTLRGDMQLFNRSPAVFLRTSRAVHTGSEYSLLVCSAISCIILVRHWNTRSDGSPGSPSLPRRRGRSYNREGGHQASNIKSNEINRSINRSTINQSINPSITYHFSAGVKLFWNTFTNFKQQLPSTFSQLQPKKTNHGKFTQKQKSHKPYLWLNC